MSETTNLKLFKHDNPETNENQFDVEKALNENWDKIDGEAGKVDTKLSKLEIENTELKSENKRLREDLKGLPKGTFSGEVIDLNDSADMRLQRLEIGGNSKQETRSGKNLSNIKLATNNNREDVISITHNSDESITFEKVKATNGVHFGIPIVNNEAIDITYYMKYKIETTSSQIFLSLEKQDNSFYGETSLDISGNIVELTKTAVSGTNIAKALAFSSSHLNVGDKITIYRVMTVKGNTLKEYEEYGASPSPNYPSEIECCGDNINLFINEDMENAYINSDGDYIGNGNNALYPFMKVNTKTIYCASANVQMANMVFVEYDKNKNFIKRNVLGNIQNGTYQLSENCNYIRFNCNYKNGVNITKDFIDTLEIKIEEGSTPTLYSKFGQGNISFEMCNKNIASVLNLETNWKLTEKGIKNLNKNTGVEVIKFGLKKNQKAKISFKRLTNLQTDTSFTAKINNVSNSDISFIGVQQSSYISKKTFEYIATEDCEIIYTMWGNANSEIFEFQFWVELGEVTEYEPHKSQTYTIPTQKPFRKIGDYKDTFIKKNGKWYERHYIARKIFDGTEGLYDFRTWGDCYRIFITITGAKIYSSNFGNGQLCSHFKYDNNGTFGINENTKDGVFAQYKDTSQFYFVTDKTSAEDFKTFLQEKYNAGTPVYIDYVLSEPKDIECTVEQTEILDKIENEAKTYKRVTHIYSTDEISPVFEGTYNKDIEAMINNIATTVAEREE